METKNQKLILHIGMAKTGSTSIQNAMQLNRDYLMENDVFYPAENHDDKTFFARIFRNDPYKDNFLKINFGDKKNIDEVLLNAKLKWDKKLKDNNYSTTIISCEGLTFLKADELEGLKNFLLKYFDENNIKVVVYARDPISFIKSMISWGVKKGVTTIENAIEVHKEGRYFDFLSRYEKLFNNIIIRPFKISSFYKGELIDDFFKACDIDIKTTESMYFRSNEAIGLYSAIVLSSLNEKYPIIRDGVRNPLRGLNNQLLQEDFLKLFVEMPDEKFDVKLDLNKSQKNRLNEIIDHLNNYFEDKDKFISVDKYKDTKNLPRNIDDVPKEFFIDLVNQYNSYIEKLL